MCDSESGLEKDDPPAIVPPSAYFQGRRASAEPHTIAKLSQTTGAGEDSSLEKSILPSNSSSLETSRPKTTEVVDEEQTSNSDLSDESFSRQPHRLSQNEIKLNGLPNGSKDSSDPTNLQTLEHIVPSRPEDGQDISESEEHSISTAVDKDLKDRPVIPFGGVSEWSHQVIAPNNLEVGDKKEDDEWQDMPAYGKYDLYDDDGNLVARAANNADLEADGYEGLGGAGKGYTRVQIDDDAKSATSMDENTSYLFKDTGTNVVDEDEEHRDPLAQMQATKHMLTEGQRIAYVGVTRLAMVQMVKELEDVQAARANRKEIVSPVESMKMWSQKMMVRLYRHMEIDPSEQIMIEQLAEHGVQPQDLTPALMLNSRVKNPMASENASASLSISSPTINGDGEKSSHPTSASAGRDTLECSSPEAYDLHKNDDLPDVRNPSMLPATRNIDIDLRWTVLCDLFLVLIADSVYDARSRVLLEAVGSALDIKWLDICRFEKRVTDALEMQEAAARETWDEADHMESRRKLALKRRYVMMGLATVGGSLVIGLSAGLLAPVIGAGLAAGFTTIGVAGTSGFLAGAGGTALITTGAVLSGGTVAVRASHRRTGAVKTFEYRPLHNNQRVNLIVTISGWMNGKIDDVRLPFSTVDPIMGDMYSLLWEPDMLQSMGDTIRILATEALTQGLQQVLASTILTALMASLTLPIVLTKLSYLIDNPWTVSLDRADAAGLILADSLENRNLGVRPITLVGFSLGSRLIFSCLRELARKGAYGLVQNVYLFGSPVVAKKEEYLRARSVVSGRFVSGYATNDWILGYLFRATSGGLSRIAGLHPVENVSGLENIDVTTFVKGHMAYRAAMPILLREVGWEIESEEFSEIEDPDPDNHEKRQRELIREIDEARKEAQAEPEKRRFGFFKKGKLAQKKGWETYDERLKQKPEANSHERQDTGVLFDIDAIRAELESEQMEVKQLESTLPPMKLELNGPRPLTEKLPQDAFPNLRETKSFDSSSLSVRPKAVEDASEMSSPASKSVSESYDEYDGQDDDLSNAKEQVSMSFDTNALPPPVFSWQDQTQDHTSTPQRPELRSAATMPLGVTGASLEHNAWTDDEEEFGKEKEVKLSFA